MLKHIKEHWAKEIQCNECEYTGTALNLKAHIRQHDPKFKSKCDTCQQTFVHRMSLWRHKKSCKRSGKGNEKIIKDKKYQLTFRNMTLYHKPYTVRKD